MYPPELKYTKDHEWIRVNGSRGHVGITDYAQRQLGDVVYVDLPEVGRLLKQGEQFGSVESVKAASDLYCPVSGKVAKVNGVVANRPESVNQDPYGTWMIIVQFDNPAELSNLLDAGGYGNLVE